MGASLLSFPAVASRSTSGRELSFFNLNTGERVRASYWEDGHYLSDGLAELNHIFATTAAAKCSISTGGCSISCFCCSTSWAARGDPAHLGLPLPGHQPAERQRKSRGVAKQATTPWAGGGRAPARCAAGHICAEAALDLSVGGGVLPVRQLRAPGYRAGSQLVTQWCRMSPMNAGSWGRLLGSGLQPEEKR